MATLAWATRRSRPRWACRSRRRSGGCRGCARRARKVVPHNLGRPRRLVCILRDLCVGSVGLMKKSGACSCCITDQRLGCHRAVLFSRQCPQTSAGIWCRAQPPQRPGAHEGGALTREAGDMWVRTAFFFFFVLPSHFRHSCR